MARTVPIVCSIVAIGLVEVLDYYTGPSVSFSLLYLVPVAALAWHAGMVPGVCIAIFSVVCESVVDWVRPEVTGSAVYLWNAFSRGSVLIAAAVVVARVHRDTRMIALAHEDSERRFGLLADALTDFAIVLFDPRRGAVRWSAATLDVTGHEPATIEGASFETLFPAAEGDAAPPAWHTLADGGTRLELERWTLRRDGTRYWANVFVYPLGERRHLAVVRDETMRKTSEDALRAARDEAVALAGELASFSHIVAHDLRAPLRTMQAYSRFIQEDVGPQLDPAARGMLERIGQAAVRMDHLIRDVLSYSELTRAPPAAEVVDLGPLVEHVVALYPDIPRDAVEVRAPLGAVRGQASLLTQVLANLLRNAVAFAADDRPPRVVVRSERRDQGLLRVFVSDNGIGIPAEHWSRIFQPFERLGAGHASGTGMGLAIVKKAVEWLGGTVGLESEVGRGSTFWFELPEEPDAP